MQIYIPFTKDKVRTKLFNCFWKTKNIVTPNDNKMELSVEISPKFGKIGCFIWYFLECFLQLDDAKID